MKKLLAYSSVFALIAGAAQAEMAFNRIASFATPENMAPGADRSCETSAEIIATPYIFIAAERASVVAVYDATDEEPISQATPASGIGSEGHVAIPERNLLVSANKVDLVEDDRICVHVMAFERAGA